MRKGEIEVKSKFSKKILIALDFLISFFLNFMFITILAFIIILGVLVLAHELGHFATARIFKTKVHEFGFGFPPRVVGIYKDENKKKKIVWGKKFKAELAPNTVYSLNLIPIGGFVQIKGENATEIKEPDSFGSKKIWQRTIMLSAGVFMNVVLCAILLAICFNIGAPTILDQAVQGQASQIKNEKIQIISINKNSPADLAGLQINDSIVSLDNNKIDSVEYIQNYISQKENQEIELEILRNSEIINITATPEILKTSNKTPVLGIGLAKTGVVSYSWYYSIWLGIKGTYNLLIALFVALAGIIKSIFSTGEMAVELAGPIGIAVFTGQMIDLDVVYVLQFAALLSLNLALINILPFPALDGGRILFLIIEKIRGKEANQKIENIVHTLGFAVLMILIVFITYKDLARWGGEIFTGFGL